MTAAAAQARGVKATFPLSAKIGLWLGLNLLLLLAAGLVVFWARGGPRRWLEDAVGDRLRIVSDQIIREMRGTDPSEQAEILARYGRDYGLRLVVLLNSGQQVLGDPIVLPAEVRARLQPSADDLAGPAEQRRAARPPPPPLARDGRRPNADAPDRGPGPPRAEPGERPDPPPPRDRQRPRESDRSNGRVFLQAGEPPQWYAGDRVPVSADYAGPPSPGILLAITASPWGFSRLLDLPFVLEAVGLVLVLSLLFWLPLVVGMTRALRTLMQATERIALGRFDTRVPTARRDEIGRLGESINDMAARLERLVGGQKKFLADVAHELGSPVGRMQVGTSILEDRVPPDLRPAVADVREEVEQMGALIAELLAFTRAGHRPADAPLAAANVADAVQRAVAREGAGRLIAVTVEPDLWARADAALLTRVVSNLVRNAVRYAGEQAHIAIEARSRPGSGRVWLAVADDGPGVPEDTVARLGEPFFRPDAARTREAGGTGLGLSIVKEAVDAMAGTVRFANRVPCGFVAEIELSAAGDERFTEP